MNKKLIFSLVTLCVCSALSFGQNSNNKDLQKKALNEFDRQKKILCEKGYIQKLRG